MEIKWHTPYVGINFWPMCWTKISMLDLFSRLYLCWQTSIFDKLLVVAGARIRGWFMPKGESQSWHLSSVLCMQCSCHRLGSWPYSDWHMLSYALENPCAQSTVEQSSYRGHTIHINLVLKSLVFALYLFICKFVYTSVLCVHLCFIDKWQNQISMLMLVYF